MLKRELRLSTDSGGGGGVLSGCSLPSLEEDDLEDDVVVDGGCSSGASTPPMMAARRRKLTDAGAVSLSGGVQQRRQRLVRKNAVASISFAAADPLLYWRKRSGSRCNPEDYYGSPPPPARSRQKSRVSTSGVFSQSGSSWSTANDSPTSSPVLCRPLRSLSVNASTPTATSWKATQSIVGGSPSATLRLGPRVSNDYCDQELAGLWAHDSLNDSQDWPVSARSTARSVSPLPQRFHRSVSAVRLFAFGGSGSFSGLTVGGSGGVRGGSAMLFRADSDVVDRGHQHRRSYRRRPSSSLLNAGRIIGGAGVASSIDYTVVQSGSNGGASASTTMTSGGGGSNLYRLRNSSLGMSDPQLGAHSPSLLLTASPPTAAAATGVQPPTHPALSAVRMRKEMRSSVKRRHSHRLRRSFNASTSPIIPRCRSPNRLTSMSLHTAGGSAAAAAGPSAACAPSTSQQRVPLSAVSRTPRGAVHHPENRRWSLASLPSSSGYGTPGSNSAFSSQYSSSERLAGAIEDLRINTRFDSNDSYHGDEFGIRPRSRSLNYFSSPIKFHCDNAGEIMLRNNVYKERFPKAKQQMEERLEHFVAANRPLSGVLSCEGSGALPITPRAASPRSRRGSVADVAASSMLERLMADGSTRFLHHQIVEMSADCLQRSREDVLNASYFCDMSQGLEDTLVEAREKTGPESFAFLTQLARQLLMIVSRTARLLECLEFDPDEFYQLLEEAEGRVKDQLGVVDRSVPIPDLPHYIISKLGLDQNVDEQQDEREAGVSGADDDDLPLAAVAAAAAASSSFDADTGTTAEDLTQAMLDERHRYGGKVQQPVAPKESDFDTIKLVSNGAYGAVYLVRHRGTRHRYALKKLNKASLLMRNQVEQVYAERDILTFTDNPFVVSFYGSFETKNHLCMVMEYVEGGDCATLLKHVGPFPADLARLYIAETVLAVEYLHSYGIVHRDLKPDNLLITGLGHIKLTDFGLSKIGLMNRTTLVYEGLLDVSDAQPFRDKQLCGTPEYIAPEVIMATGYGKPVDWWAVGVILYEFLVGCVPFFGESPEELFNIVTGPDLQIEWPDDPDTPSPEAQDLITSLLQQNPFERLGTVAGAEEMKAHPFFDGKIAWHSLLRNKAEFVPQLDNEEDTSYFDTRTDRYNHEGEASDGDDSSSLPIGDDANSLFWSFSSCASPRHSFVSDQNILLPAEVVQLHKESIQSEDSVESGVDSRSADSDGGLNSIIDPMQQQATPRGSTELPLAALLRRRFSSQRHHLSSSSGSGAATPPVVASSAESSMDVGQLTLMGQTSRGGGSDDPPEVEDTRRRTYTAPPLPRFAISCDPEEHRVMPKRDEVDLSGVVKELSPVAERQIAAELPDEPPRRQAEESTSSAGDSTDMTLAGSSNDSPPPSATTVVMRRHRASSLRKLSPQSSLSVVTKSPSLHLVIPSPSPCSSAPTSAHSSNCGPPPLSPASFSSGSTADASVVTTTAADVAGATGGHPPVGGRMSNSGDLLAPSISALKPPIVIKRGPKGFGFTIRSVRVYLGEESDYYTIQHIVTEVDANSPAYDAGLRAEDLITHVNGEPVQNITHPQLMRRLLSYGDQLNLRVTALNNTSIRMGAGRKTAGRQAKRKSHQKAHQKMQRRTFEKKRRSSLFRRLSGKRTSTEITGASGVPPGTSSQKQGFMPRSVSSQEGIISPQQQLQQLQHVVTGSNTMQVPMLHHKRLSDVGLGSGAKVPMGADAAVPIWQNRPSTLQGLKYRVVQTLKGGTTTTTTTAAVTATLPATGGGPASSVAIATTAAAPPAHPPASTRRKQSQTVPMPVSPLARQDSNPTVGVSGQSGGLSPTRSPSPLAVGYLQTSSTVAPSSSLHVAGGSSKKTVTKPRKSDVGLVDAAPLLPVQSQLKPTEVVVVAKKSPIPAPKPKLRP